ncbi:PIF1 protein [Hirsutella rhossiliensis]
MWYCEEAACRDANCVYYGVLRVYVWSLAKYGKVHRETKNRAQGAERGPIRYGVPVIWFTLNPNDITNLVKLRLAAHRGRDGDAAEAFLRDLGTAYKRTQLAISDPMSSAVFFHREMTLFFEHYVRTGEESVFGHVGAYYGAVETNERGALHLHGLLWLKGNRGLGEALAGADTGEQAAYRERIVRYIDSVFSEELDAESYYVVQVERSATADISSQLYDVARFTDAFDEEANFCAGATQVHTHSATCAPWRLVERTALTADGVLEVRRTHSMVNRWNRAMAVGLRHNHDISFIATQRKTMALIYYITNYATKVEDPIWKRVAAAAELLPTLEPTAESDNTSTDRDAGQGTESRDKVAADPVQENKTRVFLLKAANRVFTERSLSQVEVIAHLLGYPAEFSSGAAWAYINVNQLYWAVFRRWQHLRQVSGAAATGDGPDETVVVEAAGPRLPLVEAYQHRGELLQGLCLYDYASLVRLKRRDDAGVDGCVGWGEISFTESWALGKGWVQALRRLGKGAMVCLDGYLSKDFSEEDEDPYHQRAAVQHLALFVPWGKFLSEEVGDIKDIWARARELLTPRVARLTDNVQLLRRSAEDAKRDAKQWAATSEEGELTAARAEGEGGEAAEQRRQHDKAHALWRRFTTVVMLDEQMRAAGDPELRRLLGRIRRGEQDRSDLELLNSRCHRPGTRIAWETGVTVVTPLNRNRWNLNLEAALAFQVLQQTAARVFLSEHKWKGGEPTEEEAVLMLGQGDDSATPVPAVFVFVPGMPVVVNQNTHQGLKVVNGAGYTAVAVIPDRAFPGHRVSAELTVHFGPPAGLVLASETTKDFHFVGMPAGTILLTPISVKITAQRKRPWQRNDVSRRGLPCAAAFACTDYKVQGGTIERVALELRGARTATVEGRAVASPCDPYSLYVQLSRCPTLDGITLVSEVRERDFIGNRVPEEMTAAQARLEELSRQTTREAGSLLRG